MSIANYITCMRLIMSPLFLWVYLDYESLGISLPVMPFFLCGLLTLSEFSDALDGFLARKYNQVTDLGKVLDPMADSIARVSMFLTFTLEPVKLPMLLIFIFFYRDALVSTLRTICALNGMALAARRSGKIKAVLQAVAACVILLLMVPFTHGMLGLEAFQKAAAYVTAVAALYSLYSGFDYIYANWHYVSRMIHLRRPSKNSS